MNKQFFFGFLLTLLLGGFIYISFRSDTLIMFNWFNELKLNTLIIGLREYTIPFKNYLPQWVIFSLPDGLWIFSSTSIMLLLWNNKLNIKTIIWILLIPLYAFSIEILQLCQLYPGTFDIIDIILYIFGIVTPLYLYTNYLNFRKND